MKWCYGRYFPLILNDFVHEEADEIVFLNGLIGLKNFWNKSFERTGIFIGDMREE